MNELEAAIVYKISHDQTRFCPRCNAPTLDAVQKNVCSSCADNNFPIRGEFYVVNNVHKDPDWAKKIKV